MVSRIKDFGQQFNSFGQQINKLISKLIDWSANIGQQFNSLISRSINWSASNLILKQIELNPEYLEIIAQLLLQLYILNECSLPLCLSENYGGYGGQLSSCRLTWRIFFIRAGGSGGG